MKSWNFDVIYILSIINQKIIIFSQLKAQNITNFYEKSYEVVLFHYDLVPLVNLFVNYVIFVDFLEHHNENMAVKLFDFCVITLVSIYV